MTVRIGSVGYLNANPLTSELDPAAYDVLRLHPRAIAAALDAGEVAAALVPVAAVLTEGAAAGWQILPGWCVGADGEVESVVIAAETPPEAWTEVLLDQTSRTSITLARLVLAEGPLAAMVRPDLVVREVPPGAAPPAIGGTVAGVVIGDPARELPAHLTRWDLAALWKQWTGLPFVFAVWAARPGVPADVVADLRAAGERGVAAIPARHAGADLVYLTHRIRHVLDERALMGLRRFAALARRAGLVADEHVHLVGPAEPRRARDPRLLAAILQAADGAGLAPEHVAAALQGPVGAEVLLAAASLRDALHGRRATWLYAAAAPLSDLEAPARAAAAGQAAVVWDVAAEASPTEVAAAVGAARAAGVDALGITAAWAAASGGAAAARAAGLADITWRVGAGDAAARALAGSLRVHAEVALRDGDDGAAFAADLAAVATLGDAVVSVTVVAPRPAGSLVTPGATSPLRGRRATALARLALPHVRHVCAAPAVMGLEDAAALLDVGADDLGVVGEGFGDDALTAAEAERVLRAAGRAPQRRDASFADAGAPLTEARRVRPVTERAR